RRDVVRALRDEARAGRGPVPLPARAGATRPAAGDTPHDHAVGRRRRRRGVTGLRDRSKAARRARLLRAAARLFASRGYAATTISDIARAAGMATGTVFLYARD